MHSQKIGLEHELHRTHATLTAGPRPEQAKATIILLHGRGASADDMLGLYKALQLPSFAAVIPQADANTWYPQSFLAPLEANQPYLDAALHSVEQIVSDLLSKNIPSSRISLLGFSQGACLATEYAARFPRHYGAIIGLTGGLIGPPGTPRNYPGSLEGTPIFLGSSDPDPHVPFERVQETETILAKMGARVELRRYPGMPHTVCEDEIEAARTLLQQIHDENTRSQP